MVDPIGMDGLVAELQRLAKQANGQTSVASPPAEAADFATLLSTAINKVNTLQQAAQQLATSFEQGDTDSDLADVMVALQKANIGFQTLTQVRNKLVRAYQDVMNMPI